MLLFDANEGDVISVHLILFFYLMKGGDSTMTHLKALLKLDDFFLKRIDGIITNVLKLFAMPLLKLKSDIIVLTLFEATSDISLNNLKLFSKQCLHFKYVLL